MALDHEQCYRAVSSRDSRFDGYFVGAVRTTGIYCRPSCPAVTPKRANIEFFPTAAAAHDHGYRACKRCRPDASPGSPEWDIRSDVVARAMRLIGDGVVDRDGVSGARRTTALQRSASQPSDHRGARCRAVGHRSRAAGEHRSRPDRDVDDAVHGDRLRRRVPQHPPVQRHRAGGVRRITVAAAVRRCDETASAPCRLRRPPGRWSSTSPSASRSISTRC